MRVLIMAIVALFSHMSMAEPYKEEFKAKDLLKLCKGSSDEKSECSSYIRGVRAGMHAQRLFIVFNLSEAKEHPSSVLRRQLGGEPFCLPPDYEHEDVVNSVVTFIEGIPGEKQEMAAGFAVILGLNNRHACK